MPPTYSTLLQQIQRHLQSKGVTNGTREKSCGKGRLLAFPAVDAKLSAEGRPSTRIDF